MTNDATPSSDWTRKPPSDPGFYRVRMRADAWERDEPGPAKIARIEPGQERFDAVDFGGLISEPLWEWQGPYTTEEIEEWA